MPVVVFGASGFFGSHVVEQLSRAGDEVRAVVRASSDRSFLDSLGVQVATIDFSDASLREAMRGASVVYNCTANTRLHLDEETRRAVEVELTRRLVRGAARANASRFVQLSTIQVYGRLPDEAVDEDFPCHPVHQYQRAAVEREEAVIEEASRAGISWVLVRPATTTGARDTSLLKNLYPVHKRGFFPIFGAGRQRLSLVDARDVGRAMRLLGGSPEAVNGVFLVGGAETTWPHIKEALDRATGRTARSIHLPVGAMKWTARAMVALTPRSREPALHPLAVETTSSPSRFDDTRIRALGFVTRCTLDDTIKAGVEWIDEQMQRPPSA